MPQALGLSAHTFCASDLTQALITVLADFSSFGLVPALLKLQRDLDAAEAVQITFNDLARLVDTYVVWNGRRTTNMGVPFETFLPYGIMLGMFGVTVHLSHHVRPATRG